MVTGWGVLLIVSDKGEWEGGSCWRRQDFHKGDAISLVWGRGDAWRVWQRAAAFIAGVGCIGHFAVVGAEVVMAETAVFEAVSMRVMVEWTKANVGICTGYLAWAKLDKFVGRVDGEVTEKRPEVSPPLPSTNWADWSNVMGREMYLCRVLERLNFEYPSDSTS